MKVPEFPDEGDEGCNRMLCVYLAVASIESRWKSRMTILAGCLLEAGERDFAWNTQPAAVTEGVGMEKKERMRGGT